MCYCTQHLSVTHLFVIRLFELNELVRNKNMGPGRGQLGQKRRLFNSPYCSPFLQSDAVFQIYRLCHELPS